jgi:hypothetical protein
MANGELKELLIFEMIDFQQSAIRHPRIRHIDFVT